MDWPGPQAPGKILSIKPNPLLSMSGNPQGCQTDTRQDFSSPSCPIQHDSPSTGTRPALGTLQRVSVGVSGTQSPAASEHPSQTNCLATGLDSISFPPQQVQQTFPKCPHGSQVLGTQKWTERRFLPLREAEHVPKLSPDRPPGPPASGPQFLQSNSAGRSGYSPPRALKRGWKGVLILGSRGQEATSLCP